MTKRVSPPLTVAYLTPLTAHARSRGVYFHIAEELRHVEGVRLVRLGPFSRSRDPRLLLRWLWYNKVQGRRYSRQHDPIDLRHLAAQTDRALRNTGADLVFCPNPMYLAHLNSRLPCAFWHDATYANLLDFYFAAAETSRLTLSHGHDHDRRALERCAVAVFSSQWAAESAIRDYGADPAKVKVVPRGASIEAPPTPREAAALAARRLGGNCRLLLVGVSWERKGADLAVAVADSLADRFHIRSELHVVGCRPPEGRVLPSYVSLHGYLDKRVPAQAHALKRLFESCCFFVMPSRAECQGIAFCEASGYALPSVGAAIGGVSDAVCDNVNGRLFPLTAFPDDAAEWIANLWADPARYVQLCLSSYRQYQTRLNWRAGAESVVNHIREALGSS